jgi:transposase
MTESRIQSAAGESAVTVRAKRKFRSRLERRKIAEEALKPGASVASVAKTHSVRPNQVRHWRRLYCQGLLDEAAGSALLPVTITDTAGKESSGSTRKSSTSKSAPVAPVLAHGTIRIETEKARVLIEGAAEPASLRVVLEQLLG